MFRRAGLYVLIAALAASVAACSSSNGPGIPGHTVYLTTPKAVSPARIKPAPMAKTPILPSSVMTSAFVRKPMAAINGMSYTQIPGAASYAAAAPDGSLWVLSTQPAGADKYIWHYANGTWTNISGLASRIAVAPNGTLYAINSGGGAYSYSGGTWAAFGGGCRDLTAASDGSLYVISNAGASDGAIWHYNGGWTQVPGSGVRLAASWDSNSYSIPGGTITPNGLYVVNSANSIYYLGSSGYVQFPGSASAVAPMTGGLFALGGGGALYYYDLTNPGWNAESGSGVSITTDGKTLYVVSASGAVYSSPITPSAPGPSSTPAVVPGPGTPLSGAAKYRNGWAPFAIATGLDLPVQHGWNGSGQSVAIVIDSDVSRTAVQNYLTQFGIPMPTITTVSVDGANGIATNGDQVEAYLDVETVAGLAPGAKIYIYQMPDLGDQSITDAYSKLDSDGLVRVANSSFGGCEFSNPTEDPFIAQGTAAGITYVASAGDSGNVCDGASQVGASWPASNPNVVSAGGTETAVTANFPITSNSVWNDSNCGSQCGGGGGVSGIYPLPSYQKGLAGASSAAYRNEPDVSLPAEDTVVNDGVWIVLDGTSWSSPEYAALMAEVLQYCNATNGIAQPVQVPYFVASHYPAAYIDVTKGDDQFAGTTPFYTATAGYDNASGFGVPYGMAYANTVCPGRTKASGLLARSALSAAQAQPRLVNAPLDLTPRVGGLLDRGPRSQVAMTRVQLVLNSEADRAAVEDALRQAGFVIDGRFRYNRIVHAQAAAGSVERFFGTQLHDVLQPRYGTRYMPVTKATLPPSIAGHVVTVNLDNVITRRVLTHEAPGWPLAALN